MVIKISAIAAMASNRVIGLNNQLPWHLPEDLKFFKEKTKNSILLMGRKTFESLKKPLPNRYHLVITRDPSQYQSTEQVKYFASIEQALKLSKDLIRERKYPAEVFVVGGGEIYTQSEKYWDTLYLTVIEKNFEGDAYFPKFIESDFNLKEVLKRELPFEFEIRTYQRINSPALQ